MRQNEKYIIDHFLEHLREKTQRSYYISSEPDAIERNKQACEAVITDGECSFLIEHTAIHSYANKKRDDARFKQLLEPVMTDLNKDCPFRLSVTINAQVVQPGFDWESAAQTICKWARVNWGNWEIEKGVVMTKEEIPFSVHFFPRRKIRQDEPRRVFISRFILNDVEDQRMADITRALQDKSPKLNQNKECINGAILLLEANDIALANAGLIGEAFVRSYPELNIQLPDQVWLIESDGEPHFYTLLYDRGTLWPDIDEEWQTLWKTRVPKPAFQARHKPESRARTQHTEK